MPDQFRLPVIEARTLRQQPSLRLADRLTPTLEGTREGHMGLNLRLGLLALVGFSLWPAVAAADTPPPCNRTMCRSQIDAQCGSPGGEPSSSAWSTCSKNVIAACQSGQIVCGGATTTTTAPPTTTTTAAATTTTTAAPTTTTTAAPTTTTTRPTTT